MKLTTLTLFLTLIIACQNNPQNMDSSSTKFDWQGHRGARGLLPENTIPSFLKALEFPVKTLELDVVVSKDNKLIISHEPWFSHHICIKPDSSQVTPLEEKELLILNMTYKEIKAFDCGSRGNERFPEQQKMKVYKPSLKEMVNAVETYCKTNNRELPFYNIEIKSNPEYYDTLTPNPENFVKLVLQKVKEIGIYDHCNLQSFDINILNEIHKQDDKIPVAYLIETTEGFEENLKMLNFLPTIYSPYHIFVNKELVEEVHSKKMKLIPWTVNEVERMKELIDLGVDGIITDFPNQIEKVVSTEQK
jgi:glycerophosphoryl diester phosphodiesterase